MSNEDTINRRKMLSLLAGASLALCWPSMANADDDESDDDGGDSSGSGSGGSGSGSDGSDDSEDSDDDDDSGDDDSGDYNSGSGSSGSGSGTSGSSKRDQDRAKAAVLNGDAIPLSKALALLKKKYDGRVIEILYASKGNRIDYRFKILNENGKVSSVTMDARTGRVRGFLGF
jgi:uncharacterized membrane protein YkoI